MASERLKAYNSGTVAKLLAALGIPGTARRSVITIEAGDVITLTITTELGVDELLHLVQIFETDDLKFVPPAEADRGELPTIRTDRVRLSPSQSGQFVYDVFFDGILQDTLRIDLAVKLAQRLEANPAAADPGPVTRP